MSGASLIFVVIYYYEFALHPGLFIVNYEYVLNLHPSHYLIRMFNKLNLEFPPMLIIS